MQVNIPNLFDLQRNMVHTRRINRWIAFPCILWLQLCIVNGSAEIELAEGIEVRNVGMPGQWYENAVLLEIRGQNEQTVPAIQIDLRAHQCKAIAISDCPQAGKIANLTGEEVIEYCFVSNCDQLRNLEFLRKFKRTKYLQISGCQSLNSLEGIQHLKALKQISVSDCQALENWSGCSRISGLVTLEIRGCPLLTAERIRFLASLKNLSTLNLDKCEGLNRLDGISKLHELRSVSIGDCPVEDISPLLGMRKLELLDLRGTRVKSLTGLAALLKMAILENNVMLKSIKALGVSSSLSAFQCDHRNGFSDLRDLEGSSTISWIQVPAAFLKEDISKILPNLKTVVLRKDEIQYVSDLRRTHRTITFVMKGSTGDTQVPKDRAGGS
jgi:Leucine-rich repeat (LRR) protein